jgi:L-fuculose-phosphate aldolase
MLLEEERNYIVDFGKKLVTAKLTTGTGGNLSMINRSKKQVAISPSGLNYFKTRPVDVVITDMDGRIEEGSCKPSSELKFHLELYRTRADIQAIVHTHSVYATTIACLGWELPPVHYLIGFSGRKVPIAPYATFGTQALARHVAKGIGSCNAILLANHGLVTVGADMAAAFTAAEEIEFVARVYYQAKNIGEPTILPDHEIEAIIKKFQTYEQLRK